jgi:glycosyltransferase involved in cell wall biosynthesis
MGMGHNLELILGAAKKLEEEKDIKFVFIGEGPKYNTIQQFAEENSSKNILLLPLQDEETFPYSMACGDVGIVTQEASMAHLFMPSKVYSMMACGEAIVGVGTDKDDLYKLIDDNGIGLSVLNDSLDQLVNAILKLRDDEMFLKKCQERARNVAEQKYDLQVVHQLYRQMFDQVLKNVEAK